MPETQVLRLLRDGASGRDVAYNSLLGRSIFLPQVSDTPWVLHFTEDGVGFFACGDERLWASAVFQESVVDVAGVLHIVRGPDDVEDLQADRSKHIEDTVRITLSIGALNLNFFFMDTSWNGARVFWCLKSLFLAAAVDTKMKPASWISAWWEWWRKDAVSKGFEEAHIRDAAATLQATPSAPRGRDVPSLNERVLPRKTVSTYGALLVLCRHGAPSKSKDHIAKRKKVASFHLLCIRQQNWRYAFLPPE